MGSRCAREGHARAAWPPDFRGHTPTSHEVLFPPDGVTATSWETTSTAMSLKAREEG